jgi:hypothetical protein
VAVVDLGDPRLEGRGPFSAVQRGRNPHHFQLFGDKHALAEVAVVVWGPE